MSCCIVVGNQWTAIVPLVQILVIGGYLRSLLALGGSLFEASGHTQLDFRMQVPRFAVIALLIWPACAYYGLTGVGARAPSDSSCGRW